MILYEHFKITSDWQCHKPSVTLGKGRSLRIIMPFSSHPWHSMPLKTYMMATRLRVKITQKGIFLGNFIWSSPGLWAEIRICLVIRCGIWALQVCYHIVLYLGAKIKWKCQRLSLEMCGNLIRKRKSGMWQSPQRYLTKCSKTQIINIQGTGRSKLETRTMWYIF